MNVMRGMLALLLLPGLSGCENLMGRDGESLYIQAKDSRYHRANCSQLKSDARGYAADKVIRKGYKPCPTCMQPATAAPPPEPMKEETPPPVIWSSPHQPPPRPAPRPSSQPHRTAQTAPQGGVNTPVSFEFENMPLGDAIGFITGSFACRITCDPQVRNRVVVHVKVHNRPLHEAMRSLAAAVGANAHVRGNSIHVSP